MDVLEALRAKFGDELQDTGRYVMVHDGIKHIVYATRDHGPQVTLTEAGQEVLAAEDEAVSEPAKPRRGRPPKADTAEQVVSE